jgi:hypothetical protein
VHHAFLATDAGDPRRRFLETLARAVGERGTIVVYNAAFESGRLAERAAWIRDLAAETERIRDRLWDLLPVVRRHVDHPAFLGSFGLKRVLPAIAALGYEHLAVQGGSDAGAAWDRLVRGAPEPAEAARLEQAPRADCRQDSAGLLDLIRRLTALAEGREIRA